MNHPEHAAISEKASAHSHDESSASDAVRAALAVTLRGRMHPATGRLLVFPITELKLQSNGGRGLTLMDVDAKAPLVSATTFAAALRVEGLGRGGKTKEEVLRASGLAAHAGKRARKGRKVDGFPKPMRVAAATP